MYGAERCLLEYGYRHMTKYSELMSSLLYMVVTIAIALPIAA